MKKIKLVGFDLSFEIELLDGTVVQIRQREKNMSVRKCFDLLKKIEMIETVNSQRKEKDQFDPIEIVTKQLELVYDKPAEWWANNINNIITLKDILISTGQELAGVKKKETS